jgi:hypothetical protein
MYRIGYLVPPNAGPRCFYHPGEIVVSNYDAQSVVDEDRNDVVAMRRVLDRLIKDTIPDGVLHGFCILEF